MSLLLILLSPGGPGLNRSNRRLIPTSCNFFSGSPSPKNSKVKRARVRTKCAKKTKCCPVGTDYVLEKLTDVSGSGLVEAGNTVTPTINTTNVSGSGLVEAGNTVTPTINTTKTRTLFFLKKKPLRIILSVTVLWALDSSVLSVGPASSVASPSAHAANVEPTRRRTNGLLSPSLHCCPHPFFACHS